MRSTPSDLESVDIGAEIQLRRRDAMAAAVTREKRDLFARQLSDDVRIGGPAPRRVDRHFLLRFKAGHRVQPAAADNSDGWFHSCISSSKTPPVEDGCTKT